MGGKVQYAVSGGAPLGTRLGHFYRGIGVIILEGYGLTETTAPVCVNTPDKIKIGTVGPPLPGSGIRVADDGEILLKGIGVFRGYHGNEQATADAVVDGWFHTGDIGALDEDGYLRITGRKKELLVTAGGKNVAPAVLEDRLRAHPLVSQCIVVGDQKPFIAALVTIDDEMWPLWAKSHGLEDVSIEQARTHPVGARGPAARRRPRQPGRVQGRVDPQVHGARRRLHRGQRLPDSLAQAQAQRRHEGLLGRRRQALRVSAALTGRAAR